MMFANILVAASRWQPLYICRALLSLKHFDLHSCFGLNAIVWCSSLPFKWCTFRCNPFIFLFTHTDTHSHSHRHVYRQQFHAAHVFLWSSKCVCKYSIRFICNIAGKRNFVFPFSVVSTTTWLTMLYCYPSSDCCSGCRDATAQTYREAKRNHINACVGCLMIVRIVRVASVMHVYKDIDNNNNKEKGFLIYGKKKWERDTHRESVENIVVAL